MATTTVRPRSGRPGQSLRYEYKTAMEQHAVTRRERLARAVPRAAVKAAPFALGFSLLFGLGLRLGAGLAVLVFFLIVIGWPLLVIARAYNPVPEIEELRKGAHAERKTADAMARLRRYGYTIMHDRLIPDEAVEALNGEGGAEISPLDAVIGHVLIGPGGVFVVASDSTPGQVRYTKAGAVVDGESLKVQVERAKFYGDQIKARIRPELPMIKIPVLPVLVMVEAGVFWADGAVEGVTIVAIKDVVRFVRSKPHRMDPAACKKVAALIERTFPAFSPRTLSREVTLSRDQWIGMMHVLRTIRERGGDASALLDRVAHIEGELARAAEPAGRRRLSRPGARDQDGPGPDSPAGPGATGGRRWTGGADYSGDDSPTATVADLMADADADSGAETGAGRGSRRAGRGRPRILSAVPEDEPDGDDPRRSR
jgi:Nuclease-related domain